MRLLQQYGDFSLAYSTAVQPSLKHFGDLQGYVTYRERWGVTVALGDPVTADGLRENLLNQFLNEHKWAVFCQISRPTAEVLAGKGYYINQFGVDTILDLDTYTLAGKSKEWLRYAANWIHSHNYRIEELNLEALDLQQIENVSEAWRATRTVKHKEVRFLNRPIVLADELDVRRFFLRGPNNEMLAYVYFDPLYRDNAVSGYVTSIKRRHPDAPLYAEHAIMKNAIEKMKSEGVGKVQLGLSPFAWLDDGQSEIQFKHSSFTAKTFRLLYNTKLTNRMAYNLVGHAQYKRRFRGREEKVYFASPSYFSLRQLVSLLGLCGIA